MRIRIVAAGRIRGGPEKELVDRYLGRFDKVGRTVGLGPSEIIEFDPASKVRASPADRLFADGATKRFVCLLDERGHQYSSVEFARMLENRKSDGVRELAFLIGGPDGIASQHSNRANASISMGRMVFPHKLVRVMLAEQLYRAASILGGQPYHRV